LIFWPSVSLGLQKLGIEIIVSENGAIWQYQFRNEAEGISRTEVIAAQPSCKAQRSAPIKPALSVAVGR
jgi:hypothetical protein